MKITTNTYFYSFLGDEVLEWNGHSVVGKSYEEVHDVIADSRLDSQVELRVARNLLGGNAQSGYPPSIDPLTGRPTCDPRNLHHQYSVPGSSRSGPPYSSVNPGNRGGRSGPSVTLSDPLGGTTHMLNPHHTVSNHPAASTRIQVGFRYTVVFAYISLRPLEQFHIYDTVFENLRKKSHFLRVIRPKQAGIFLKVLQEFVK